MALPSPLRGEGAQEPQTPICNPTLPLQGRVTRAASPVVPQLRFASVLPLSSAAKLRVGAAIRKV
jgi:hypothetical protein